MVALNDALLNAPCDVGFDIFNDINDIVMYWSTMPGRKWWKTVKQVTGDKVYSGIPTLIENGSPIINSIKKADIFNNYFASQCQLPDGSKDHPLPPFRYETDERSANINFFPSNIYKILINLDVNKATGPDKIGIFLLKNVANSISEPLCKFFNYSIQNSTFPPMNQSYKQVSHKDQSLDLWFFLYTWMT